MGKTLVEKIISEKTGLNVKATDIVITDVDLCYAHEGTGPLALEKIKELGKKRIAIPKKTLIFFDHCAPSSRKELSNDQMLLRDFAEKH